MLPGDSWGPVGSNCRNTWTSQRHSETHYYIYTSYTQLFFNYFVHIWQENCPYNFSSRCNFNSLLPVNHWPWLHFPCFCVFVFMCVFVPEDEAAFDEIFQKANFTTHIFKNQAKLETYNVSSYKREHKGIWYNATPFSFPGIKEQRIMTYDGAHHCPASCEIFFFSVISALQECATLIG